MASCECPMCDPHIPAGRFNSFNDFNEFPRQIDHSHSLTWGAEVPPSLSASLTPAQFFSIAWFIWQLHSPLRARPPPLFHRTPSYPYACHKPWGGQPPLSFPQAVALLNSISLILATDPEKRGAIVERCLEEKDPVALRTGKPHGIGAQDWANIVKLYENVLLEASVDADLFLACCETAYENKIWMPSKLRRTVKCKTDQMRPHVGDSAASVFGNEVWKFVWHMDLGGWNWFCCKKCKKKDPTWNYPGYSFAAVENLEMSVTEDMDEALGRVNREHRNLRITYDYIMGDFIFRDADTEEILDCPEDWLYIGELQQELRPDGPEQRAITNLWVHTESTQALPSRTTMDPGCAFQAQSEEEPQGPIFGIPDPARASGSMWAPADPNSQASAADSSTSPAPAPAHPAGAAREAPQASSQRKPEAGMAQSKGKGKATAPQNAATAAPSPGSTAGPSTAAPEPEAVYIKPVHPRVARAARLRAAKLAAREGIVQPASQPVPATRLRRTAYPQLPDLTKNPVYQSCERVLEQAVAHEDHVRYYTKYMEARDRYLKSVEQTHGAGSRYALEQWMPEEDLHALVIENENNPTRAAEMLDKASVEVAKMTGDRRMLLEMAEYEVERVKRERDELIRERDELVKAQEERAQLHQQLIETIVANKAAAEKAAAEKAEKKITKDGGKVDEMHSPKGKEKEEETAKVEEKPEEKPEEKETDDIKVKKNKKKKKKKKKKKTEDNNTEENDAKDNANDDTRDDPNDDSEDESTDNAKDNQNDTAKQEVKEEDEKAKNPEPWPEKQQPEEQFTKKPESSGKKKKHKKRKGKGKKKS